MKFILGLFLMIASLNSFAQVRRCEVHMRDRVTHRLIMRFFSQTEPYSNICRQGLRNCNFEMRRRNIRRAICVQVNQIPPTNYRDYYLNMSDRDLLRSGLNREVGICTLARNYSQQCDYLMSINGRNYPNDFSNGCTTRENNSRFGCAQFDQELNALCVLRRAISLGDCGF